MINSFRFLAILTFVILHAVPGHGQQLIPQPSELAYAEGRFTITPETVEKGEPPLLTYNPDRKPVKIKITTSRKRGRKDTA